VKIELCHGPCKVGRGAVFEGGKWADLMVVSSEGDEGKWGFFAVEAEVCYVDVLIQFFFFFLSFSTVPLFYILYSRGQQVAIFRDVSVTLQTDRKQYTLVNWHFTIYSETCIRRNLNKAEICSRVNKFYSPGQKNQCYLFCIMGPMRFRIIQVSLCVYIYILRYFC
jgi:hypothetical protein